MFESIKSAANGSVIENEWWKGTTHNESVLNDKEEVKFINLLG